MFITLGVLLTYVCLLLIHFEFWSSYAVEYIAVVLLAVGFMLVFLWMSILSFHVWWSIRYF